MNKKTFILQYLFFIILLYLIFELFIGNLGLQFHGFISDMSVDLNPVLLFWNRVFGLFKHSGGKLLYIFYPIVLIYTFIYGKKYVENEKFLIGFQVSNLILFSILLLFIFSFQMVTAQLSCGLEMEGFNYIKEMFAPK